MAIMLVIIKDSIVLSQPTLPRIDGLILERRLDRYVQLSRKLFMPMQTPECFKSFNLRTNYIEYCIP